MAGASFKAILFDLGHTLIHFRGNYDQVLEDASHNLGERLNSLGFAMDKGEFASLYLKNLKAYYLQRIQNLIESGTLAILQQTLHTLGFPDADPEILAAALPAFFATTQQHWHVVENAPQTLDVLFLRGYRLGVLSNASNDLDVQHLVDQAGFRPCLEFVLTSAAVGFRKPHPEIFKRAIQAFDLPPSQIALVGDQLDADILGGNQVSLHTILVTAHQLPQHEAPGVQPAQTIARLPDLLQLFPDILSK